MIFLGNQAVGVTAGVGDFTLYEKKTLTFPNATNSNVWANNPSIPCSFAPKFVVFYSNSQETAGCIYGGEISLINKGGYTLRNGVVRYINLATSNDSQIIYYYNETSGNVNFYVDSSNNLHIDRASGNGFWSNTYEYTFEIYG